MSYRLDLVQLILGFAIGWETTAWYRGYRSAAHGRANIHGEIVLLFVAALILYTALRWWLT